MRPKSLYLRSSDLELRTRALFPNINPNRFRLSTMLGSRLSKPLRQDPSHNLSVKVALWKVDDQRIELRLSKCGAFGPRREVIVLKIGAGCRTRTGTILRSTDFKSVASTNSANPAKSVFG